MTKEEAVKLGETGWYKEVSNYKIVKFQLFEDRLCMPFDAFHEAIEKVFGRPVFTHEFAYRDSLIKEFIGDKPKPTFEEVLDLLPNKAKLIFITKEAK